ncbi:MAG: hypothetical protein OXI15_18525, partial [Chromatiales bacterium]|nr:hypothetical protein [Chromatiales bacterium]
DGIIPAFAGMTVVAATTAPSMASFPRRRESIGVRRLRMAERRTHQSPAPAEPPGIETWHVHR